MDSFFDSLTYAFSIISVVAIGAITYFVAANGVNVGDAHVTVPGISTAFGSVKSWVSSLKLPHFTV